MKIKQLNIYGYGKWVDEAFDFDPHFQVIAGPNEAGKSTLLSFIQSILFGFPKKSERDLRYEPKQSSAYGGYLVIETEKYGTLQIERIAGRSVTGEVKITQEDGSTLPENVLDELLGHLDRTAFKALYGFNLSDLEEVKTLDPDEIQNYFTSIGATGSSRYLRKMDELNAAIDELYKARGQKPEINQLMTQMKQLKEKMQNLQTHYQDYLDSESDLAQCYEELKELQTERKELEDELGQLPKWQEQVKQIEQMDTINEQLAEIPALDLPEDGLYHAEHLEKEIAGAKLAAENARQLADNQESLLHLTDEEAYYLEHVDLFDEFHTQKNEMDQIFKEIKFYKQQISELEEKFAEQNARYPFVTTIDETVIPEKLSLEDQDELVQWQDDMHAIQQMSEEINYEMKGNQKSLEDMAEQANELKDMIRTNGPAEQPVPLYRLWFPIVLIIVSFLVFSTGFFVGSPRSYLFWLVGGLGIAGGVYGIMRAQTKKKERHNRQEILEQIRKRYQRIENQMESIRQENAQLTQQLEKKHQRSLQYLNQFNSFKIVNKWPAATQLAEIINLDKEFDLLRQQQYTWQEHHEDIRSAEHQLLSMAEKYPLYSQYDGLDNSVQDMAKNILTHYQNIQADIAKIQPLLDDIAHFEEEEQTAKAKQVKLVSELQQLLNQLGAKSKDELAEMYAKQTQRQALIDQIDWLNDQLSEQEIPYPSQEALDEFREKLISQKENLEEKIEQLGDERTHIEAELLHLAQDGTYEKDRLLYEGYKTELSEKIDEWASLKMARYILDQMLKIDLNKRYPIVIQKLNDYFTRLTHGRYQQVSLSDSQWVVQHANGQYYDLEELSRGTIEPLYLSFRLAFAHSNQDILNLPLIIDDAFVNFDQKRYQETLELLEEMSKDIQIIYLTIDQNMHHYQLNHSIIDLHR